MSYGIVLGFGFESLSWYFVRKFGFMGIMKLASEHG